MKNLHNYFMNPFDDPNISLPGLVAFTTDHLQRILANTNATVAPRIGPTTAALASVSNAFSDDETKLGLRMARKLAKNNYRVALPKSMGKIAVTVEGKFGEGSPEFKQCFPHGRTVFNTCNDDLLTNELQAVINGVTALQATLGAPTVTDATALLTGWSAVYSPSESAGGAKTATIAVKNAARLALQLELYKTLLTLALAYPRQPEQLDLYMQPSLLLPHTHTPATPPPATTPTTEP